MAVKRSGSSVRAGQAGKSGKRTSEEKIDFSDIPESTDEQLARARRVGRPRAARGARAGGEPRQLIAIRIEPTLLAKLRKMAAQRDEPYQAFIHDLLARAAEGKAA